MFFGITTDFKSPLLDYIIAVIMFEIKKKLRKKEKVPLLVRANSESANRVPSSQCIQPCRRGEDNLPKLKVTIGTGRQGNSARRAGQRISQNADPFRGFTENGTNILSGYQADVTQFCTDHVRLMSDGKKKMYIC